MNKTCKSLCIDTKPKEYNKLFFGDYGNFSRIDYCNYDIFQRLAENSESNVWFTNEINYSKDKKGYSDLNANEKRAFHKNILYQNLLDSLVPNTFGILSELSTDTYLSYLYSRINTEENIHAMTYSSGLMQVFGAQATKMLDDVYNDQVLKERMRNDIEAADALIDLVKDSSEHGTDEMKKALIVSLVRTYFLEGVRFPASFFVTWTINKNNNNCIQGFSQALKLILWDELTVHTTTGQNLLKILMRDSDQGFTHLGDFIEKTIYAVADEVLTSEIEWAKYLLQDGEIHGYNINIAEHFIKYMIDFRLKALGMETIHDEEKSEIIDWFNDYRNINKTQIALQEADNLAYQKGAMKNDLDSIELSRDLLKEAEVLL
jgi:ribonucleoside-diphosphate reductase beta chain